MGSVRWRVQASWDYDGERRSYSPVFADSREEALRLRREMHETLWHFVGLVVDIVEVDSAVAAREMAEREPAPPPNRTIHVMGVEQDTLCGAEVDLQNGALDREFLSFSTGPICPECVRLL